MKLTKSSVAKLEPRDARFIEWDEALPGFGLVVQPTGSKTFVVAYRPAGTGRAGPKRRVTLGRVETLSADDARRKAAEVLAVVRLGGDPAQDRATAKAEQKFADVFEEFLADLALRRKPKSVYAYRNVGANYLLPTLASKRLKEITRADLRAIHQRVSAHAPYGANRALGVFSSLWGWAARRDLVEGEKNPSRHIEKNREQGRQRFLSDQELVRLGEALRLAETEGLPYEVDETKPGSKHNRRPENRQMLIDPRACAAIRLLLATGCRLNEVLRLRWDEVDRARLLLNLKDSKTGARPVVVSQAAMDIIMEQPREVGSPYVFPGQRSPGAEPQPRSDLKRPWARIAAHAGLEGVRLHDLRHSAASLAAGAGYSLPAIGAMLGHRQSSTTQRYAHLSADATRLAAEAVATAAGAVLGVGSRPEAPKG